MDDEWMDDDWMDGYFVDLQEKALSLFLILQ